jgi:hypothetical protein
MKIILHRLSLFFFFVFVSCVFLLFALLPMNVQADWPPRPEVTPLPPPKVKSAEQIRPSVATLILEVQPAKSSLWSVVQWQDASKNWHDVDAWRGAIVNGRTIWWVEQKDWATGPFRWVIYNQDSNRLLVTSQSFMLPDQARKSLVIPIHLK